MGVYIHIVIHMPLHKMYISGAHFERPCIEILPASRLGPQESSGILLYTNPKY